MFLQALNRNIMVRVSEHLVDKLDFGRLFATCQRVKESLEE